jgi:Ca2+:H+ antiporter
VAAAGTLAAVWGQSPSTVLLVISVAMLIAAVMAAVHHAEVIAHRLGEPFGTLVLALAITIIEVSLIVSLMLSSVLDASALARDTVFATVMIICNGVVGLCLLVGSLRHRVVDFRVEGTIPALAVLATLTTLTLVLPNFTIATSGPTLSKSQLAFAGVVSLVLYAVFVLVQTVRHRDYFLPAHSATADAHAERPSTASAWASLGLLMVALVAVVGLAKTLAPAIETVVHGAGLPQAVVGICIALMVLMPETISAVRAAGRDRMQTSFNLALGSAMATIGLTIPVVAAISILLGLPLALGLPNTEIVFLALTLLLTFMTLSAGRATVLQGSVHLVVFVTYLFLAAVP